jgi:hypothetical protein
MPLVGRNALLYRAVYPANISVSPAANSTTEAFTPAERLDAGEKARVTYTYTSDANITALQAVFRWLNSAGTEISRNTVDLTVNTTATRTDEFTAPGGTYNFQFGIRATSGATAGTASASNITERLLFGYAKSVSASIDADLVKEYVLGSDKPAYLASGNKTFKVSFELLYANDKYAQKVLAGGKFDVIIAPDGWGSGKPLVTLKNVVLNSWEQSIEQDGVIAESLEGEGDNIVLATQ